MPNAIVTWATSLFTGDERWTQWPGQSSVPPASSAGTGVAAPQQDSTVSGGGNIYVRLYIRQGKSSTAGKIKLQVRTYFYYNPYNSVNYASLKVYSGPNSSGTLLLDRSWDWVRTTSHVDTDRMVYSEWFDLPEINNTSSVTLYAICRPTNTASYQAVQYVLSLDGIHPSYQLDVMPDNHISGYSYTIQDCSCVYGSNRENLTGHNNHAVVYKGDKVTWSATPKSGYRVNPSSGTVAITGNCRIDILSSAMATLRMKIGGTWNMYSIYVRRGGAWLQHQAHIRQSGSWNQYS